MDIKAIHDIITLLTNFEQATYFSHEEIDMFLDRAQMSLFNDLYNNPRTWAPGKHTPVVGYGESQRINDALAPFKSQYTFTVADGLVTLPSDYMYLIALKTSRYVSTLSRNVGIPVKVLNEEELVASLESQVDPVSIDGPIAIINGAKKIQLFPDTVSQTGTAFYFRRPAAPKFGYTQSGRVFTYDPTVYNSSTNPTGSIQLEWGEAEINSIISRALAPMGLNMSAQDVSQYAELKIQQGN